MKKFRLLTTLFTSILSMSALAGCTETPTTPEEIEEIKVIAEAILPEPASVQREGVSIESIEFINIPEEGIPVGSFDSFDIKLKIVYSDGYVEYFPLLIENFPDELKTLFNTIGEHYITIAFKGEEVEWKFNVIAGVSYYLVKYYSYDGRVIQREQVSPTGKVQLPAPAAPSRAADPLYRYTFDGWSETIDVGDVLTTHHDIYPQYQKTQKRYDVSKQAVPTVEGSASHLRTLKENKGQYQSGAYLYAGRIDRVPLVYSDRYEITQAKIEHPEDLRIQGDLYFDSGRTTSDVINEIYAKGMNMDVSEAEYETYFAELGSNPTPVNPEFSTATLDITDVSGVSTSVLFEGDVSYSEIYYKGINNFVESLNGSDANHKLHYDIMPASDMLTGNKYYRAAIETSVDVLISTIYNKTNAADLNKYQIVEFEYIFLINPANTYLVTEFTDAGGVFESTGTRLSYSMYDLDKILKKVG